MKNKIFTILFLVLFASVFIVNLVNPIQEISYSERRKLTQFPSFSWSHIYSGKFMKEVEKYTLDQFAFREEFRSLKAFVDITILNKSDNNNIYVIDHNVFKMEYPLNMNNVNKISKNINMIYDLYLKNMNVFYSIIPDKNYFVEKKHGYLTIDYKQLVAVMNDTVENMKYIDIMKALELSDYYRTDTHWKQENLGKVVETLGDAMSFETNLNTIVYTEKTYYPFYGVYYGQSALSVIPDILTYKVSKNMQNAIVQNYDNIKGEGISSELYKEQMLGKMDSYDVFLSGATPLITIENPNNTTQKELIIFRDSFASSLAPLLIEEYSKITLIDLRYINYDLVGEFVEFTDQDILFLYSTLIINSGTIIK